MHRIDKSLIAIIACDGFEESELTEPRKAVAAAGAEVHVISSDKDAIQGLRHMETGASVPVDRRIANVKADDYDALIIPGGLFSPDAMRTDDRFLTFARAFFDQKKPVAAICHGPQVLISADLVEGRTMTAVSAVRKDLENAGATVLDEPVVVDAGLVTSRTPDDLDAFCGTLVEAVAEGRHRHQHA